MRYTVLLSTKRGANRVNPGQARSGSNAFIPTPRRLRVFCSTAVMTWFPPIIVAVGPPTRRRERNSTSAARRDPGACNPQGRPGTRTRSFRASPCTAPSAKANSPESLLSQWLEDFLHVAVIRYQDFRNRRVVSDHRRYGENRAGLGLLSARDDVCKRAFAERHQSKLRRRSCDVRNVLEHFDVRRPLLALRTSAELLKHILLRRDGKPLSRRIDRE